MKKRRTAERRKAALDWSLWGPGHTRPKWWREDADEDALYIRRIHFDGLVSTVERPMTFLDSRPGAPA